MKSQREFLSERYQRLRDGAVESVVQGLVAIDPLLATRAPDPRRCLTLLARPSAAVQGTVGSFLDQLRAVDSEQYYYDSSELHVTVLSLFTANADFEKNLARYAEYLAAVNAAVAGVPAFDIDFTGVTFTREAVMIQGFFDSNILNDTREALRRELRIRCLTDGLDSRYILQIAHMTAVRFRKPLTDSARFAGVLHDYWDHSFGHTRVAELNLVQNDWYMSNRSVEVRGRYLLA